MVETLSDEVKGQLVEASRALFGDKARLCIVDPQTVVPLKKNARYMRKPMFDQLAANVADDGFLSSVPLCQELEDGRLEVLSGNHRIKAAIRAGIERILVIVIPQQSQNRKVAIQLSHNALEGLDDNVLLAELWSGIEELDDKLYSGLDTELVAGLDNVNFQGFSAVQPQSRCLVLWFLPEEVEALDGLLLEAETAAAADQIYLAPAKKYSELLDALIQTKKLQDIKNTAVAFMWLMNRLAEKSIFDGLDPEDEPD